MDEIVTRDHENRPNQSFSLSSAVFKRLQRIYLTGYFLAAGNHPDITQSMSDNTLCFIIQRVIIYQVVIDTLFTIVMASIVQVLNFSMLSPMHHHYSLVLSRLHLLIDSKLFSTISLLETGLIICHGFSGRRLACFLSASFYILFCILMVSDMRR